jgi:hypothetical protein
MSESLPDALERVTGDAFGEPPPKNVLPVPAGSITYTQSAKIIFPAIAEKQVMYIRESVVHEIRRGETDTLQPVEPDRFCSVIEKLGRRVARREKVTDGDKKSKLVWRSCTFPQSAAKVLLSTDEARTLLPTIRRLANCPILTTTGEILTRGYHDFRGGTFISSCDTPLEVTLEHAVEALTDLLADFDFATGSDASRALASLISPALKMGGHITDDFPVDLAEADQSQSGKTFRQKLVAMLYNESPAAIMPSRGGVGSLDESIAAAMIQGRPFIALDNIRGRVDSAILESAIRGHGRVTCRALRTTAEVDTEPFLWQLSTNGAELTRDLANRSVITRIRKQPDGYRFRGYPEGDLLSHVRSRQAVFSGAIFAVVRAWMDAGSPTTDESRHDFRGWVRALDWIVQNIFDFPPLLDGHREEQSRTANPNLQWLRDIILAAQPADIGREMSTGQFVRIAEDAGIEFPGNPNSRDDPAVRAGRILGKIFRDSEGKTVTIDGFKFTRIEAADYSPNGGGELKKFYTISRA